MSDQEGGDTITKLLNNLMLFCDRDHLKRADELLAEMFEYIQKTSEADPSLSPMAWKLMNKYITFKVERDSRQKHGNMVEAIHRDPSKETGSINIMCTVCGVMTDHDAHGCPFKI